jgi:DNA-binding response OmpR family regulator
MADDLILIIEKENGKTATFAMALERKGYLVDRVPTGTAALKAAANTEPAVIVLNAASLGSSGVRICRQLIDETGLPVIHIVQDDGTAESLGDSVDADVLLELPFTVRKLHNRIKRFIPANRENAIEVGPVTFAPKVRVVRAYGRESRLTPKGADLLALMLDHPDETLSRSYLMRQVWDTSYVGDTRTLDVHIRWVRQSVEKDPANPRHIVTVRGVGYRFMPDPPKKR